MEKRKLTEICNPKQWKTIPTSELVEVGYPVYGANGIIGFYNEYNHEEKTIAITCRGATCGTVNLTCPKAYITGNAMCLDDVNNTVILEYLFYAMKAYDFSKVISGSAQPQITRQGIEKVEVVVYPPKKQQQIVCELQKVESLIALRKEQLTKLDELVKSRFVELFGDPVADSMKWGQLPLSYYLKSIRYGTSTPPSFSETGYEFIRATNIKNGQILSSDMKYISEEEAKKIEKCKVFGGEMIIVRSGVNAGDTCIITGEHCGQYAGYDMILVFGEALHPVFANVLINTEYMDRVVKPLTRRAAQPHLNSEQVQSLPIIQVPYAQQEKFAAFVEQADKSKLAIQESLAELETLKKALMQKYFG